MNAEIVCSKLLNKTDLATLLAECPFLRDGTFLGEMVPAHTVHAEERDALVRFIRFDTTQPYERYVQYTSGRIFHDDFELRWQHEQDKVRVIYIGRARSIPFLGNESKLLLEKYTEQQHPYYLFGERLGDEQLRKIGKPATEGDFAEARIPRLLHYPIEGKSNHAQLVVREYCDETGQVALHRFVTVKEAR